MKKSIIILIALMSVISVYPQKKSKNFILSEPKIWFVGFTNMQMLNGSEHEKFYEEMKNIPHTPLDRSDVNTEVTEKAKAKRNEFQNLASYDNFKKHKIILNAENYTTDDIKYKAFIKVDEIDKLPRLTSGLKCYIMDGDTLVTERIFHNVDGYGKAKIKTTEKFKPHIKLQDYINKLGLNEQLQTKINEYHNYWQPSLLFSQQLKQLADEVLALNKEEQRLYNIEMDEKRKREQEISDQQIAEDNRKRLIGNLFYEFKEPTNSIQTKSYTTAMGAKITYQYYIGDNGYEVKHGQQTTTMTFKNHKYWTGIDKYGWIYVDGTENITEHFRNGISHGTVNYKCNVKTDSTFGNEYNLNKSYNLSIYKGFLTDNFEFEYKGIKYKGKAVKGILDYCNYETSDGYHGKLTSNPNGKYATAAVISGGNIFDFKFDIEILLPTIAVPMSTFRFPLIGSND